MESLTSGSEELSQYTERAVAYLARVAALYALADKREEINERDLDAALALVSYSVESVSFTLPEAEMDREVPLAIRLERFLREAGPDGVPATQLYRKFDIKSAALKTLTASMHSVEIELGPSTGGRRPEIYKWIDPDAEPEAQAEPPDPKAATPRKERPLVAAAEIPEPGHSTPVPALTPVPGPGAKLVRELAARRDVQAKL
ncbi:hypothetical protein, partial [Acrocarpospora sp. B8E8]|uniref:hypothetical protein n=1 Tax=Acrocarpospora sp. B8E8 TaxID=3153572 RepID=UPI00325C3693